MANINSESLWLIFGLVLMITEMMSARCVLFFLSAGSFAAAIAAASDAPVWLQVAVFVVTTAVGLVFLRKPVRAMLLKAGSIDAAVGKEVRVSESIEPHQQTQITFQGSHWLATNTGEDRIDQGDRAKVIGIDGSSLLIRRNDK